ncbi:nuclear transport factor 2 family protein [Streptomyces pathocidini]|uniref:Nuclear transport factor 2 family protein n=1 Tax=Streptomyces pathocidini TaxID=1650571 RepID=A0ABW7UQV4_9ACTN|nr:nuclear transport factor 2 family protein [Streptomyces pathocidini]
MTQRAELTGLLDRLAIDDLITGYARTVDDGDWAAYRALFTSDGRADYRSAGGIEGPAAEVAGWLEETMRLFPVRQHLILNRHVTIERVDGHAGDSAVLRAEYVNPMRLDAPGPEADQPTAPNFTSGGRYTFRLRRTDAGWRMHEVVVREKWRRTSEDRAAQGG